MGSRRLLVAVGLVASLLVAAVPIAQASNGRASFIVVLDDSVDAPRGSRPSTARPSARTSRTSTATP